MKEYVLQIIFCMTGLFLLLSELCKQLLLTIYLNHGNYNWWYLPFQLCSIPMYLLLIYPYLKKDRSKEILLTFLSSFTLLGGAAAFFDTSGMYYPVLILTIHSFLWHIILIVIGLLSGIRLISISKQRNTCLSWQTFLCSVFLYGSFCLLATAANLLFSRFGTINMFYINPELPMQQLYFREIAEIWGNSVAIIFYLTATVAGSTFLFFIWRCFSRFCLLKRL